MKKSIEKKTRPKPTGRFKDFSTKALQAVPFIGTRAGSCVKRPPPSKEKWPDRLPSTQPDPVTKNMEYATFGDFADSPCFSFAQSFALLIGLKKIAVDYPDLFRYQRVQTLKLMVRAFKTAFDDDNKNFPQELERAFETFPNLTSGTAKSQIDFVLNGEILKAQNAGEWPLTIAETKRRCERVMGKIADKTFQRHWRALGLPKGKPGAPKKKT